MWYKVYADGTLQDIILADSKQEAVALVKTKILLAEKDISFEGISWSVGYYG